MNSITFSTEELSGVAFQISAGDASGALDLLQSLSDSRSDPQEREFLFGCAYEAVGKRKEALHRYLDSAFGGHVFVPAVSKAATLLSREGYKREADFVVDKARKSAAGRPEMASLGEFCASFTGINAANHVVAIHQPSYLPWLGFFHKIFYADTFVILDNVEFSKNSFIKRTLINKTHVNEGVYLTIPAAKHSDFVSINAMVESPSEDWRTSHLRKIHGSYNRAPYFREFYPLLEKAIDATRQSRSIAAINEQLLQSLLEMLGLKREIHTASAILDRDIKEPHERNMWLCQRLGGNVYFSGATAIDYQRDKECPPGMRLIYQRIWEHIAARPYLPPDRFSNGLSILDCLFTAGPDAIFRIFESYSDPSDGHCFES
jgi:hypothetical protein